MTLEALCIEVHNPQWAKRPGDGRATLPLIVQGGQCWILSYEGPPKVSKSEGTGLDRVF